MSYQSESAASTTSNDSVLAHIQYPVSLLLRELSKELAVSVHLNNVLENFSQGKLL